MASRVFVVSGASGSGKTTLLDSLQESGKFPVEIIGKVATRPSRADESKEILCVKRINHSTHDILYEQYGIHYGLSSSSIWRCLRNNHHAFVIVNDIRAIEDVKETFGVLAVTCYLYRCLSPAILRALARKRTSAGTDPGLLRRETERRIAKLSVMYQKYIENISLFDHVILNTSSRRDLLDQAENLIRHYQWVDGDVLSSPPHEE